MADKAVKNPKLKVANETKAEKKVPVKKVTVSKARTTNSLTIDVVGLDGKVTGQQTLSETVFGQKMNKALIAQAVRVYLSNQRQGTLSTKSRGEVKGSSRKIYRQKGTGRARHGGIRAPLFVGGGVAHGPTPRDFSLSLPQKMRQLALASVLSGKVKDGEIKIVSGLMKIEPKTKVVAGALKSLELRAKGKEPKVLLVINDKVDNVVKAARNIEKVGITSAQRLNVYDVLTAKQVIFMQEALATLEKRFSKEK